jgi:integration host factor subunit beta
MSTVTKKELVEKVAQKTGADRGEARRIVQAFLDSVVDELNQGNRLEFRDFGVFEVRQRAPRTAQNPKTLVPVQVPAKRTVRFKPGRLMREQSPSSSQLAPSR